jgi:WD40 repeat protein
MRNLLFVFIFFLNFICFAQAPDSDIWLFEIDKTEKDIQFKKGINATNNPGYDNQPFFSPDNRQLLFTSIREGTQSDIYRFDLRSKKTTQITKTKVSEYSPMMTPDLAFISVVVVEQDSSQRIWKFKNTSTKNEIPTTELQEQLVDGNLDSVGYYWWLNNDSLIYYKLTQPHSLWVADLKSQKHVFLCQDPTRSFRVSGYKKFIYGFKGKDKSQIREYDWRTMHSTLITEVALESEDFIWHQQLGLLKSEGKKLMRFDGDKKVWLELADFSSFEMKKITRFAFSPNGKWLAVVGVIKD